ncbi:MAG: class I SAM-dependent methyltransferase [Anaeroplasmataceae bacterium]
MAFCQICNGRLKMVLINHENCFFCTNCEVLTKINIPSIEEEKNRYDKHIVDDKYYEYMKKIYESIRPYLNKGNTLDFGCGKVEALKNIMDSSLYNVISYDKIYFNNEYCNKLYDNIIMIEVIEHINNFYDTIKELKKILNVKGRIIINTNLHNNNFLNWWYFRDKTHIAFFNQKSFINIAASLNLKIVVIKGNLIVLES